LVAVLLAWVSQLTPRAFAGAALNQAGLVVVARK
jgi:hypothetical protein